MKVTKCAFILLIAAISAGLAGTENPAKVAEQAIVKGNNEFALRLFAKLRADKEGENLFFSPYSISTALAMTYAGARGRTEAQMAEVLGFPTFLPKQAHTSTESSRPVLNNTEFHSAFGTIIQELNQRGAKGAYELTVANALWGQRGCSFLKDYLESIETNYGGALHEVDFIQATEAARKTMNTWVEEKTKDKIKELIKKGVLDKWTRLVLTNAIYFKGNWASKFKEQNTKDAPFTLPSGKKTDAPMMNQKADFEYMETDTFQALELPYVDDELSMIIFLPRQTGGLTDLEQSLTTENLSNWLAGLHKREVVVFIPKFKMTSQFSLADVLKSMGMTDAFSGKADFSGMTGKKDFCISAVIHKAYVDVNEEGTEAAAATAVVMKTTAIMRPLVFRADRPFLFLIRDNLTGSILFIGRVTNPKEQNQ